MQQGQTTEQNNFISVAPKSICILRLSAIGDVCHAVSVVQHIQKQMPNCKITWVIGKIEAMLLADLPGVEFIVFDKSKGFSAYKTLWRHLKQRQFDVLLHMQVALRASLVSVCIPAKVKIGFDKKRAKEGQWLFSNKQVLPQVQPHVLDGFMSFANALGLPTIEPKWEMPLSSLNELWASEQFESTKPVMILAPAASKAERNWHAKGYAQAADYLVNKGFQVAICGGPSDMERELADEIQEHSEHSMVNLVGKTSLPQLLAVLKHAHLVIAPDTGPTHMAVTVGTPVIGLYAHSNPKRTGPYLYQKYVVSCYQQVIEQQYGQSLDKLPWGIRAKGKDLMNNITIEQVTEKLDLLLADFYPEV